MAKEAFATWRSTPLSTRTRVLFAYRELLERHHDELVRVVSSEHGKVRSDAEGELRRAIDVVEFVCGIPHLLKGEFSQGVSSRVDTYSIRQPVGVVAGITPFNFPLMVPAWMYPVAIACGNTFVLKPSEKDPSASVILARLFQEAGLPDGVFNVVQGDRVAVEALLTHPDVAAVSSVGSTPVARAIFETASAHGKRVQALGGAKNHMVGLPDADMDFAADQMVSSGYGSTGQRCMAISAVVAVGGSADPLIERVRERVERLKVGPGDTPRPRWAPWSPARPGPGALLRRAGPGPGGPPGHRRPRRQGRRARERVLRRSVPVRRGQSRDVDLHDEIFGPVLVVLRADSLGEAIDLVNANPYGNGTAIFTSDGGAATGFQEEVEVGIIGVNVPIPVPMAYYSFGGWKSSLFGDLHVHGPEGIKFYTRTKVITSRWPETAARGVNLGFPSGKQ